MRVPRLPQINLRHVEDVIVDSAVDSLNKITRAITKRSPQSGSSSSSSSPSSTCAAGNTSTACETPADETNGQTIAIVLGVIIPLSAAVLVLIFLHRRHMKRQALEDINDPHKSLDFGMDGVTPRINRKKVPEMALSDKHDNPRPGRKMLGLSMDMNLRSPYLLPTALHGSRESFHSMARSHNDEHDPYRPVTMLRSDTDSIRSDRRRGEKSSLYAASPDHVSSLDRAGLIANARPMSQSFSPDPGHPTSPHDSLSSEEPPLPPVPAAIERKALPARKASLGGFEKPLPMPTQSDTNMVPTLPMPETAAFELPERTSSSNPLFPPRNQSIHANARPTFDFEVSSHDEPALPPVPISKDLAQEHGGDDDDDDDFAALYTRRFSTDDDPHSNAHLSVQQGLYAPIPVAGQRLSVLGLRPLPPDVPDDNPEQRANRIRSFYKEYFDDSRPAPANAYYEEYDVPGVDTAAGPYMGAGQRPFAQPMGRRAMTPPPRGPPRGSAGSTMGAHPHQRKYSTMSMGRPGPRGPAGPPKKKAPPPVPLHSLPTPHMLKGDIEVFNPLDFAPPSSFRQLQNGSRPDSPLGTERAYSPSVRAFTPLASSFDNLNYMPSPHELRKSSTFTALDFAPPSRIRDPNLLSAGSETGSIRSNRSGISAVQTDAIRAGAYRVSRIPAGVVTTKQDLAAQLRPKMDMISYS